jgi:hypothetical protein
VGWEVDAYDGMLLTAPADNPEFLAGVAIPFAIGVIPLPPNPAESVFLVPVPEAPKP